MTRNKNFCLLLILGILGACDEKHEQAPADKKPTELKNFFEHQQLAAIICQRYLEETSNLSAFVDQQQCKNSLFNRREKYIKTSSYTDENKVKACNEELRHFDIAKLNLFIEKIRTSIKADTDPKSVPESCQGLL